MAAVPGTRSKFGNRMAILSLYSWNIAECADKTPTNQTIPKGHYFNTHLDINPVDPGDEGKFRYEDGEDEVQHDAVRVALEMFEGQEDDESHEEAAQGNSHPDEGKDGQRNGCSGNILQNNHTSLHYRNFFFSTECLIMCISCI